MSATDCKLFVNAAVSSIPLGWISMTVVAAGHCSARSTIAMNGCTIVVTTSEKAEHACFLAYANGARTCLKKPLSPASFAKAIADVTDYAASSASRGPNETEIL
jgi:hypothetical protein